MRITDFKHVEVILPLPHKTLTGLYVPELSDFEVQEATLNVAAHAIKLAENLYSEAKEVYIDLPLSEGFTLEGSISLNVWGNRKKPENYYEELVFKQSGFLFTEILATMFLCDVEGNCICPFDEPFGSRNLKRTKLFKSFFSDTEAYYNYNRLLLGIKEEDIEVKEGNESPNVETSVKKKATPKVK